MLNAVAAAHLLARRRRSLTDGLPRAAQPYLAFVVFVAAVLAANTLSAPAPRPEDWLVFVALAGCGSLTQLFAIQKPRVNQVFHAGLVFVIAGVVLLPPTLLALLCVLQHIPDWARQRYRWYIQTFNICNYVVAALGATAAAAATSSFVAHGLVACATFLALNRGVLAVMLLRARGLSLRASGLFSPEDVSVDFSLAAMGVTLAVLASIELWLAPFALAPLVLIFYLQRDAEELELASTTISRQNESLQEANELLKARSQSAMESLAATVDARDAYTAGHSRRVRHISLEIGTELGLDPSELETLGHAALFHDIGKIAIPDAILLKPGRLSPEEWKVMQSHAEEGAQIIERLAFLEAAVPAIRHHHERLDGSGYPDGLRGDEIPLLARIIHLADALDSMVTHRVYRRGRELDVALGEIRQAAGTQFCPRVAEALERAIAAGRVALAGPDARKTCLAALRARHVVCIARARRGRAAFRRRVARTASGCRRSLECADERCLRAG
jgi:putative nucleotidyltransferase with HDIG domain